MLAKADIIFLVDESASAEDVPTQDWLRYVVTGDANNDDINSGAGAVANDTTSLAERLELAGIDDVHYGLVGFGFLGSEEGNSFLVDRTLPTDNPKALFGSSTQLATATDELDTSGDTEDGWDAIEHAIAEYEIRPGAVPIFVMVQTEGGRATTVNTTLRQEGIEAALASKNVILNSVVAGVGLKPYAMAA